MKYDKVKASTTLKDYFNKKYGLKENEFTATITFGESNIVYFLELSYNGIWYSISDKYPIIIQEKKQKGEYLFEGTEIGLSKDEFFNFSLMENALDIVLIENVNEFTSFVYEVLIPYLRS